MRYYGVLLIIFLLIAGCGESQQDSAIAGINGKKITDNQFKAFLKFKRIPDNENLKQVKDTYIQREALAMAIEDQKLLDKELTQAELNEFRKEMLISRYFEKFLDEKVSDEAVKNYYLNHSDDYVHQKARVAHILIRTNKTMSEIEKQARLTKANEAYSHLKSGRKFEEIAQEYSEDRISKNKGGEIGWIKEGNIDPEFSKMAFSMKEGDFSIPVETAFGYHIIKMIEPPQQIKEPFESVSGDIRYMLRNKTRSAEMERLISKLKIEEY